MSGSEKSCRLQVTIRNSNDEQFIESRAYWDLIETDHPKVPGTNLTHCLLEFNSLAARERFVSEFCDGKMYGKNTFAAKYGSWPDTPYARLVTAFIRDYKGMIKCPDISHMELRDSERYYELINLYRHLGLKANPSLKNTMDKLGLEDNRPDVYVEYTHFANLDVLCLAILENDQKLSLEPILNPTINQLNELNDKYRVLIPTECNMVMAYRSAIIRDLNETIALKLEEKGAVTKSEGEEIFRDLVKKVSWRRGWTGAEKFVPKISMDEVNIKNSEFGWILKKENKEEAKS